MILVTGMTRSEAGAAADELNNSYGFDTIPGYLGSADEAVRKVYLALRDAERRPPAYDAELKHVR